VGPSAPPGESAPGVGTWHYNGHTWHEVTTGTALLAYASALSAHDIWAIARTAANQQLVMRYNGATWRAGERPRSRASPPRVPAVVKSRERQPPRGARSEAAAALAAECRAHRPGPGYDWSGSEFFGYLALAATLLKNVTWLGDGS
jgi:hypothetical protein